MTRLLHLSDLHFGRVRPDLTEPLIATINELAPDLVVVSGDFTQRARLWQFRQARAFLDRLAPPVLSVPGNHDTPLDNVVVRFLWPWRRYRRFIDRNLMPTWEKDLTRVAGVNSVNPFSWQRGRIGKTASAHITRTFAGLPDQWFRVAVMHHPLEHGPQVHKQLMRGAGAALDLLGQTGVDIVLSGHLHLGSAAPFRAAPGTLFVQAGTGLSTRLRDEENTFNLLTLARDDLRIDRYSAGTEPVFRLFDTSRFRWADDVWHRLT